jgi:hypothetical protein
MDANTSKGYTPEYVARKTVISAAHRDKDIWLCSPLVKVAIALQYLLPGLLEKQLLKKGAIEVDDLLRQ